MSTQIFNLTPHEINIGTASIKPFGVVARVYVESISDGEFTTASGVTIPISHSYYGDVENLPNPMPNTIYIVSALVASRVPTRSDVFYPCCYVDYLNSHFEAFTCTSDTEILKLLALTNKAISNILYRALQIADENPTQLSL